MRARHAPQVRPRARGARFARQVERRLAFQTLPARDSPCSAEAVPRRRQVGCSQRSNSGQPTAAWYVLVCPLWLPPRDVSICPPPLITFHTHSAYGTQMSRKREGRYTAKVRLATPAYQNTWECRRCGVRSLGECGRPRCAADRAAGVRTHRPRDRSAGISGGAPKKASSPIGFSSAHVCLRLPPIDTPLIFINHTNPHEPMPLRLSSLRTCARNPRS